jgi:hypothetical protein
MESATPLARTLASRRLLAFLGREGILVGTFSFFVGLLCLTPPWLLLSDSWLTLLGGRELFAHGFPHHDQLAIVSAGQPWVDQQWLAQVVFWGIYSAGGVRGVLFATMVLQLAALALAFALARRRGGAPAAIVPFALLSLFYVVSFMRAEVFSMLLFVVALGLLISESRRPTARVWLVFPLLMLWANLHGAVVIGVALVSFLGACELVAAWRRGARWWARPLALICLPPLCLFATPWGFGTIDYYRATIGNPVFREASSEWMAPQLWSVKGFPLFVLAALAIVLATKRRAALTAFELGALVLTLLAALMAIRSAPWFAYTCIVLLPALLQRTHKPSEPSWLGVGFATALAASALIAFGTFVFAPESKLTSKWPPEAEAAVTRVLRADPTARVLAGPEDGDWLLFRSDVVRGRLAFDGRWEVLTTHQMQAVVDYLDERGENWERPASGYRLIVLDPRLHKRLTKTYDARPGVRVLYRDENVVVYDRNA